MASVRAAELGSTEPSAQGVSICGGGGGGGMTPLGGPYWMIGRWIGGGGGGFGSLTANMVTSKTWGSTAMVTWPSLVIVSLPGLLGSSITTPFLLEGLLQYFSKMPSAIHLSRDLWRDSARTPLRAMSVSCAAGLGARARNLPLLDRLVVVRREIVGLLLFDGGQRFARLDSFGQRRRRRRLIDDRRSGRRGQVGRRGGPLFGGVLDASSSSCWQLPLLLHGGLDDNNATTETRLASRSGIDREHKQGGED